MDAPQNFRSAFNGFNREDVVRYLEFVHSKYNNQINRLTAENQELQAAVQQYSQDQDNTLQDRCAELSAQLEEAQKQSAELVKQLEEKASRCEELEKQLEVLQAAKPREAAPSPERISVYANEELEAYRRAERIEREARERSALVYFQANGVLTEATAKVNAIAADVTDMADQVMSQLTQLQIAVSSSKQALQDASSIMNTIRPNK